MPLFSKGDDKYELSFNLKLNLWLVYSHVKNDVDLRIGGKILVIEVLKKLRSGWFDNYKEEEELKDDVWNDTLPDDITEDWEW